MIAGKSVLCASCSIPGHVIPTVALALELRKAGAQPHMVTYQGFMEDLMLRHGFGTTSIPMMNHLAMANEARAILKSRLPDITVCDWAPDMWMALQTWRPACTVSVLRCELLLGYRRRNFLLPDKFDIDSREHLDMANGFFRRVGSSSSIQDPREMYRGDIIVIPSVPEIDPLPERVEENYSNSDLIYTGPLLLPMGKPPSGPTLEWFARRREEGIPVLMVTLGTVWGAKVYEALADCLEALPVAVAMVIPYEQERSMLQLRNGERLHILGSTDLRKIADQSDIVMHHCGHGTMHNVLLSGKPSITLPSGEYDREDAAYRLEDLHCGIHLTQDFFRHGFDSRKMRGAVEHVLSDKGMHAATATMSEVVHRKMAEHGPAELTRALDRRL